MFPIWSRKRADGRVLSIREQMEVHRKNPACAVVPRAHGSDRLRAGEFRRDRPLAHQSDGLPVDASAVFADGTPIEGVQGLRQFLVKHRENYVHTFVEKLLTYALGRHVDYRDQPAIRRIVREAAAADYRWSAIILGIVRSTPFQMRKTAS